MKALLIYFNVFLVLYICGCSKKKPEIELTKDNISKLEFSKLTKVFILVSVSKSEPNKIPLGYHYEYPIDSIKGRVILRCIEDANYIDYDADRVNKRMRNKKGKYGLFGFETKKTLYTTTIVWDDESAYGFWFESKDLLSIFRGWGLFEDLAKADPNWPSYSKKWPEPNWPHNHQMTEKEYMELISNRQLNRDEIKH